MLFAMVAAVAALAQDASLSMGLAPEITVKGAPGTAQQLEGCDALLVSRVWRPLTNVVLGATPVVVTDLTVPLGGKRFYRTVATRVPSGLEPAGRPEWFVLKPAGTFTMGSPISEPVRDGDEGPQTKGILTKGFWMSRREVTQQEYLAPMGNNPRLSISLVRTLTVNGAPGTRVQIEWADALGDTNHWQALTNVTVETTPKVVVDRGVPLGGKRTYRAVSILAEPAGRPPGFLWIPAGTFTMGTPDSEVDRGWEGPQTEVIVSTGFWMGQYEVTQKEYEAVKGAHKSNWTGANLPVEMVTWYDAVDYCSKLTEQERKAGRLPAGYNYRLPTEAEWEYACRSGTTTRFSYGDDPDYAQLGNYAWFTGNAEAKTHPVGMKLPNRWGLYDVHGNVWEWCLDWYGAFPGGKATDPQNLEQSFAGFYKTVRGGCMANIGGGCRSASRNGFPPDRSYYGIGIRVVVARAQ